MTVKRGLRISEAFCEKVTVYIEMIGKHQQGQE
jgi:hypothetical protein